MQPREPRTRLAARLRSLGIGSDSEEDRLIRRWLILDFRHQRPAVETEGWAQALALARRIYRSFTLRYSDYFLEPALPGRAAIGRALRRRLGFVDARMIEATLERIRNRRRHLLEALRVKHQANLFGAETFREERLDAYFARTAWFESLHVPEHELPWKCKALGEWEPATEQASEDIEYRTLAEALRDFWSPPNGFSAAMQLEGLLSVGLGGFTGHAALAQRAQALLQARLPRWEQRRRKLDERIAVLLDRRDTLKADKRELLTQRLDRLREMRQVHVQRLFPKPAEIQRMLQGHVIANLGRLRFQRIQRERAWLQQRVAAAEQALTLPLSRPLETLRRQVADHCGVQLLSSSQHGLSATERLARQAAENAWLSVGAELLAQIRLLLRSSTVLPDTTVRRQRVVRWLHAAEDLFEFAILPVHKGIVQALGRRHGPRLLELLGRNEPLDATECLHKGRP